MKQGSVYGTIFMGFLTVVLGACGRVGGLGDGQLTANYGDLSISPTVAALSTQGAQREIIDILDTTQNGIISSLIPGSGLSFGGCNPEFDFGLTGVDLVFEESINCHLDGKIRVKFFPISASIDMDVVGLKYVKALSFESDIKLSGSDKTLTLDMMVLDGSLGVKPSSSLPIQNLTLNGQISVGKTNKGLGLQSRFNVIERKSGMGVAFLTDLSTSGRKVKACVLTGGNPMNPQAGNMTACIDVGK